MAKIAKITIELEYDLDDYYQDFNYYTLDDNEIADDLEEVIYEDLSDLMRGDRVKHWATITTEEI